jgi:hypothetical protein
MATESEAFLARWHRIVAEKDVVELATVLAEDVTIGAPPYWTKLAGKPIVHRLLGVIIETIEDFTYHRQWTGERELALEFRGRVGGLELQGVDLITLDDQGRITNLDVMIRPINTLLALRDRVAARMAR